MKFFTNIAGGQTAIEQIQEYYRKLYYSNFSRAAYRFGEFADIGGFRNSDIDSTDTLSAVLCTCVDPRTYEVNGREIEITLEQGSGQVWYDGTSSEFTQDDFVNEDRGYLFYKVTNEDTGDIYYSELIYCVQRFVLIVNFEINYDYADIDAYPKPGTYGNTFIIVNPVTDAILQELPIDGQYVDNVSLMAGSYKIGINDSDRTELKSIDIANSDNGTTISEKFKYRFTATILDNNVGLPVVGAIIVFEGDDYDGNAVDLQETTDEDGKVVFYISESQDPANYKVRYISSLNSSLPYLDQDSAILNPKVYVIGGDAITVTLNLLT